jgi:hypothetical protein
MTTARRVTSRRERAASGLAGASGGLGLVSLANALPQSTSPLPALLIYVSPFATVLISALWAAGVTKLQRSLHRRSLEGSLRGATRLRDQILASSESSSQIKKQAQANVEKIQTLVMELILEDTRHPSTLVDFIPATVPDTQDTPGGGRRRNSSPVHNS